LIDEISIVPEYLVKPFIGVIAHLGSTKIAGQEISVFDE
jgi:hypothetical protein